MVTGGTAGVGRATGPGIRQAWPRRGRPGARAAALDGAVGDVQAAGRRGLAVPTDVSDNDAVREAAAQAERQLGEIHVSVNVAFVGSLAFFWDTTTEEDRRMTDVTYYVR